MGITSRAATLFLAAGLCLPAAQDIREPSSTAPLPRTSADTLEAYGAADRACREWTDGCATCLRRDDGTAGCSLPGIACRPTGLKCNQDARTDPSSSTAPNDRK